MLKLPCQGAEFGDDDADCRVDCVARPDASRLARKRLGAMLRCFEHHGWQSTGVLARALWSAEETAAMFHDGLEARDLLDACRRLGGDDNEYTGSSFTVYRFFETLELLWPEAKSRLVDVFVEVATPEKLFEEEPAVFHAVLRLCGRRLQRYARYRWKSSHEVVEYCSDDVNASVMLQLMLAGALHAELVQELSEPFFFFERLWVGSRAGRNGAWSVHLAVPLWLSCMDRAQKRKVLDAYFVLLAFGREPRALAEVFGLQSLLVFESTQLSVQAADKS